MAMEIRAAVPSAQVIRKAYYDDWDDPNDDLVFNVGFSFGGEKANNRSAKYGPNIQVFNAILDLVMQAHWADPNRPPFIVPPNVIYCQSWRRQALFPPYSSGLSEVTPFRTEQILAFHDAHQDVPRDPVVRQGVVDWIVSMADYQKTIL